MELLCVVAEEKVFVFVQNVVESVLRVTMCAKNVVKFVFHKETKSAFAILVDKNAKSAVANVQNAVNYVVTKI